MDTMSNNNQNTNAHVNSNKRIAIIIGIILLILLAILAAGRFFSVESPEMLVPAEPSQNLQGNVDVTDTPTRSISAQITYTLTPTSTQAILIPNNTITSTSTRSVVYYPPTSTKSAKKSSTATSTSIPNSATPNYAQQTNEALAQYLTQTEQAIYLMQTQQALFATQTHQAMPTPTIHFTETPSITAPGVSSVTPANGATSVADSSMLNVVFDKPVSVTGNWFTLVCSTSGTFSPSYANIIIFGGPSSFTLDPQTNLTSGETCTLTVFASQVSDLDDYDPPDNMAANFTSSFTVEKAPEVASSSPANGASSISNYTNIILTFDEPVYVHTGSFTIFCGGLIQPFTVAGSGTATITLDPQAVLPNNQTCTVTAVVGNIQDADPVDPPNYMSSGYSFNFSTLSVPNETLTESEIDNSFYDITGTGSTNVDLDGDLRVSFSEPVNITLSINMLQCPAGNPVPVAITNNFSSVITLNPSIDMPSATTCTLNIPAENINDLGTPSIHAAQAVNHTFQTH